MDNYTVTRAPGKNKGFEFLPDAMSEYLNRENDGKANAIELIDNQDKENGPRVLKSRKKD